MRFLGVHHDVGGHVADGATHQLRGEGRDAHVHHGIVEHAGPVRHRRAQAAGAAADVGRDAPRLLVRRAAGHRGRALLAVRAHVRRRHAGRQRDDVHGTGRLGVPQRRHRLAGRAHIPHVDAVDAADGRPVRRRVRRPVRRVAERADQHSGHGVRHGAVRHRDAGPSGHPSRRRPRPARGHVVRRTRRRPSGPASRPAPRGRVRRSRQVRQAPSEAHHVSYRGIHSRSSLFSIRPRCYYGIRFFESRSTGKT